MSVVPLHFDRKRDVKMGPERESKLILMEMVSMSVIHVINVINVIHVIHVINVIKSVVGKRWKWLLVVLC